MALCARSIIMRGRLPLQILGSIRCVSDTVNSAAEPTHTGQTLSPDDFKAARFNLSKKLVNAQFAEKMIAEVPPIPSTQRVVSCNGGGGALGHPKVYINLDQPGSHACGYCGLRFYLEKNSSH